MNLGGQQQQMVQQQQSVKAEHHEPVQQVVKQQPQMIQAPQSLVTAHRVAEILKAAGETFCRLGDCTMMLDQSSVPAKTKVP